MSWSINLHQLWAASFPVVLPASLGSCKTACCSPTSEVDTWRSFRWLLGLGGRVIVGEGGGQVVPELSMVALATVGGGDDSCSISRKPREEGK